jgi:hypothetical protein
VAKFSLVYSQATTTIIDRKEKIMDIHWNMHRTKTLSTGFLMAVVVGVLASVSQASWFDYKGARLSSVAVIPLIDGSRESGHFSTPSLDIDYTYVRAGATLTLSGTGRYDSSIRNSFLSIPRFYLRVYLADAEGRVLDYRGIVTTSYANSTDEFRFNQQIVLPPGTASMAFGYDGEAQGGSGNRGQGAAIPFWYSPVYR